MKEKAGIIGYKTFEAGVESALAFVVLFFALPLFVNKWEIMEKHQFLNLFFLIYGIVIYAVDIEVSFIKSYKEKRGLIVGAINVLALIFVGRAVHTMLTNDIGLTGAVHMYITVVLVAFVGEFFRIRPNTDLEPKE